MQELVLFLKQRGLKISVAESCTGGLFMSELTSVPGASEVFTCGFVTYSDASKFRILGVNPHTLVVHGAVSAETVSEMLEGLLAQTDADIVCAVSGIAGPAGGSAEKPAGTVYAGFCIRGRSFDKIERFNFAGDRDQIRRAAVKEMSGMIIKEIGKVY